MHNIDHVVETEVVLEVTAFDGTWTLKAIKVPVYVENLIMFDDKSKQA